MIITAALVKELRDKTGVGMAKCKEALDQTQGNIDEAIALLRKMGVSSGVKKEGRLTKEGMIAVCETASHIAFVEVDAETDFVVKNDKFQEFCHNIAQDIAQTQPTSLEVFLEQKYSKDPSLSIDQYRSLLIQIIGENIVIKRLLCIEKPSSSSIGVYSHAGGKIVTAVTLNGPGEEALAREVAMHVAACAPEYVQASDVPAAIIDQEKEIAKGQVKDKPEFVIAKILEGKLNDFFSSCCLTAQKFVKDSSVTVAEMVRKEGEKRGKKLLVSSFIRWSVGK